MSRSTRSFLLGVGKVVALVVVMALVGVGIGGGISGLGGGTRIDDLPIAVKTGDLGALPSTAPDRPGPQAGRIRILSTRFVASRTASGFQRRRARVAVRVRVTARRDAIKLGAVRLISGDSQIAVDPNAEAAAGELFDPIMPGQSATGVLRFETSGAFSDRLAAQERATLRIGSSLLRLRLK